MSNKKRNLELGSGISSLITGAVFSIWFLIELLTIGSAAVRAGLGGSAATFYVIEVLFILLSVGLVVFGALTCRNPIGPNGSERSTKGFAIAIMVFAIILIILFIISIIGAVSIIAIIFLLISIAVLVLAIISLVAKDDYNQSNNNNDNNSNYTNY